jgi:hypothetical protein
MDTWPMFGAILPSDLHPETMVLSEFGNRAIEQGAFELTTNGIPRDYLNQEENPEMMKAQSFKAIADALLTREMNSVNTKSDSAEWFNVRIINSAEPDKKFADLHLAVSDDLKLREVLEHEKVRWAGIPRWPLLISTKLKRDFPPSCGLFLGVCDSESTGDPPVDSPRRHFFIYNKEDLDKVTTNDLFRALPKTDGGRAHQIGV